MKKTMLLAASCAFGLAVGGCASALTGHATQSSLPVQTGAATTNDSPAVAWEKEVGAVVHAVAPPGYSQSADVITGAIIGLTSALAGYVGRHVAGANQTPQQPTKVA